MVFKWSSKIKHEKLDECSAMYFDPTNFGVQIFWDQSIFSNPKILWTYCVPNYFYHFLSYTGRHVCGLSVVSVQ